MNEYYIIDFDKYKNKKELNILFDDNSEFVAVDKINNFNYKHNFFSENNKIERIIYLDFKLWFNDMKKSFNEKSIKDQFKVDYDRSKVYCNGNLITDSEQIIDFIELYYKERNVDDILMFCTQTACVVPFEIIQKGLGYKYYLSERVNTDEKTFVINFDIDKDLKFTINKKMRIFKLVDGNDKTITNVNILINFDFKNDVVIKIMYNPIS